MALDTVLLLAFANLRRHEIHNAGDLAGHAQGCLLNIRCKFTDVSGTRYGQL
jgi:hypothetical protein